MPLSDDEISEKIAYYHNLISKARARYEAQLREECRPYVSEIERLETMRTEYLINE